MRLAHRTRRHRQSGSAVIVLIVVLALMLIYIGANVRTLHYLQQELKLIEKSQVQRLDRPTPPSNTSNPRPAQQSPGEQAPAQE